MPGAATAKSGENRGITVASIREQFRPLGSKEVAVHSARFFKTGKGEYGDGDRFLGIRVPVTRSCVRRFRRASLRTLLALLKSKFHEERLLAVLLLVDRYQRGDDAMRRKVYDAYLAHREWVNNWDLVDSSAHLIVGPQLDGGSKAVLYELARSASLWDRRIAIMSTYHFIRQDEFEHTLGLSRILLNDEHDLIQKAVGWMLREVGNRDRSVENAFLRRSYRQMPRTMLRYAIEKHPENERKAWLRGEI